MNQLLQKFRDAEVTLQNIEQDFSAWHKGRPRYYCWMVMVGDVHWHAVLAQAAQLLQPHLVAGYQRQPHVTILPAGFTSQPPLDKLQLAEVAQHCAPFSIALGPLSSFSSCPCFVVNDPARQLIALRRMLRPLMFDRASMVEDRFYQPHLTVGLYNSQTSSARIADLIDDFAEPGNASPAEDIVVDRLSLASYSTASIKGELRVVADVHLGTGMINCYHDEDMFQ